VATFSVADHPQRGRHYGTYASLQKQDERHRRSPACGEGYSQKNSPRSVNAGRPRRKSGVNALNVSQALPWPRPGSSVAAGDARNACYSRTNAKPITAEATTASTAVSAGPALADDNGTPVQQGDCMGDALAWCGQYIFAPDRNLKIGDCLWEHRAQISGACRLHLLPPKKPGPSSERRKQR
jgi:hypothetical protein